MIKNINSHIVPSCLRGPVCIDQFYVPRFWATVYEITELTGCAPSTRKAILASIDAFYIFTESLHTDRHVDQLIYDIDTRLLMESLEAFLLMDQNRAAVECRQTSNRWNAASEFVLSTCQNIASSRKQLHSLSNMRSELADMNRRISAMQVRHPNHRRTIRALPALVVKELSEIFNPQSKINPFRSESEKFRNYIIFEILLHCGLRAGEALLLSVDCVSSEHDPRLLKDRYWITVINMFDDLDEPDPRASPPSMKNSYATRQIPISQRLAENIRQFITHYRRKSVSQALFLSNRGVPLSKGSLESVMRRARDKLSEESIARLVEQRGHKASYFTAHELRHTCAVVLLNRFRRNGVSEESALSKLRVFFGWSHESQMPRYYARAYWEAELGRIWNNTFDQHVESLKALESI